MTAPSRLRTDTITLVTLLTSDIAAEGVPAQLCVLGFATGVLDAVSFPAYRIFLSNQTGNTIFLFLGAIGLIDRTVLANTAASLGTFLTFLLVSGQLGNHIGRRRRWWLLLSNAIQSGLILLIAILHVTAVTPDLGYSRFVPISLLSAGSGMQVAMARTLECPEVPTAMLTTPFADLLTDPEIFKLGRSSSRDKRIAYISCICSGALIGAVFQRHINESSAFFLAAAVKTAVTGSLLFNPAKSNHETEAAIRKAGGEQ
ncbi:MAG: hypothetical protein CYPHOPRED_000836 [Cyphobasidiales sp. Tagirdzhanova-0007]|nr:MAG: hypothetical protein CYPHOPRED_000836 [Cyphobasidiales sp. Tagirdzhanova-0007]